MIQFDEHIFQMGWNHQLVIQIPTIASCLKGIIYLFQTNILGIHVSFQECRGRNKAIDGSWAIYVSGDIVYWIYLFFREKNAWGSI